MSVAVLADDAARALIENSLDETLVVEAAAGTGKTTALVKRIRRAIETGRADVTTIAAVTFTEKAAGELKLRLRQELELARGAAADSDAGLRLEHALTHLEEAHIGTIHGFCADLLREHPVEAGVDPLFRVLTEAQARRCYGEAFDAWFHEALESDAPGVRRSLSRTTRGSVAGEPDDYGPIDRLRNAGWELTEWRDFPAPWDRPPFDRELAIDGLVTAVGSFAALRARAANFKDALYHDTRPAARAADELRLAMVSRDLDLAEATLVELKRDRDFRRVRKGYGTAYGPGVPRADVFEAHQRLLETLDTFVRDADAELASLVREDLQGSIHRYSRLKRDQGALDFLDLLLRARDLVRDHDDVRRTLQGRFRCLFVDEFQDTDPLQSELVLLLAADDPAERDWARTRPVGGKLFVVGDPKQSIYRFRRADVGLYQRVCQHLLSQGATAVQLTASFRAGPTLQAAVNAAFGPRMTGDRETLQARYVPLTPVRRDLEGQPSVIALPIPDPYGKKQVSNMAIERSLPDAVGAFVDWLLASGWKVTERRSEGKPVDLQARHVCILFRRFVSYGSDVTRAYVDALEARGIRHLLVGGRAFHGREEVETLRAALAAIEWPDDELSVFATLRGALFAIGDEALLEYRSLPGVRGFHPFRRAASSPPHLTVIDEALRCLASLHLTRNRQPVTHTIATLLETTRAHVGFALRRSGEQVLANVLHVAELARQYESGGGISFRGFVDELRTAADEAAATEAPIVEEGSDGVRLMTVHKAKGLEFPVVILADITAKLAPVEASRYLAPERGLCALRIGGWSPQPLLQMQALEQAREREEGVRIAYVAATRARDLLVIPGVGDGPVDGWVEPLNAATYPEPARRRGARPAPGCPPFRKDSVRQRPDAEVARADTMEPGLHERTGNGGERYRVVWWDPAALRLGVDPPFGLRRQELIARDVAPELVAEGQRRYRDWRDGCDAAVRSAAAASVEVRTATEWAATPILSGARAVDVVTIERARGRPAGPRYGTLIHAVLASVPLGASAEEVVRAVATQARITGASDEEKASAADVVRDVLRHPLLDQARTAELALREVPVTCTRDGVLVEGVADLVFGDATDLTVVDFKTGRAEGTTMEQYTSQVRLYADAVAGATGRRVRAVLLEV